MELIPKADIQIKLISLFGMAADGHKRIALKSVINAQIGAKGRL